MGNKVGVLEPFLLRMAHGAPLVQYGSGLQTRNGRITRGKTSQVVQKSRWKNPSGAQLSVDQMLRVCKRFYVALILSKLVQVSGNPYAFDALIWLYFSLARGLIHILHEIEWKGISLFTLSAHPQ